MERAMGIEPTLSAWKAEVLPLNYARIGKSWWRGQDSNLRRLSRQIYSLIPLAAREPLQRAGDNHRALVFKNQLFFIDFFAYNFMHQILKT